MAKKILIVDDEEDFLKALTIRLKNEGYATCAAKNGEEAYACLDTELPDLIVLDVMMPRMNGLQFLKKVKKDNRHKKIPVVVLTAGAFDISDEVMTLSTAQDFLLKSVDNEQITERIASLL